jgi:hypothetical protein
MNSNKTMSKENITEIVTGVISLMRKGNTISRNKAFAECFEQVETRWGKSALTAVTKKDIRDYVDSQLKESAAFTKHEVIARESAYVNVNGDGDVIVGRRIVTLNNEARTEEQELLLLSRTLNEHRSKVARKTEGATEADIRKERRLRNAINSRLHECKLANIGGEIVENVLKYVAGLPPVRNTVPEVVKSEQAVAAAK